MFTNTIIYGVLLVYSSMLEDIKEAIQLPNRDTFRGIREYLKLGGPSAVHQMAEAWAYETMTIIVGIIGVNEQAAQSIMV